MRTKKKPKDISKGGFEKDEIPPKTYCKCAVEGSNAEFSENNEDPVIKIEEAELIMVDNINEIGALSKRDAASTDTNPLELKHDIGDTIQDDHSDVTSCEYIGVIEYLEDSDNSLWDVDYKSPVETVTVKQGTMSWNDNILIESSSDDQIIKKETKASGLELESDGQQPKTKAKRYIKKQYSSKRRVYVCDYCTLTFSKLKSLTDHKKTKHPDLYTTCKDCNKTFKSSKNLRQHRVLHTSKENSFSCDTCSASFIEKRRLTLHKLIHLEKKPFQCKVCDKTFSHGSNYARHLMVHSGIRPFKCACGREFSNSTKLKYHKKVHANEVYEIFKDKDVYIISPSA